MKLIRVKCKDLDEASIRAMGNFSGPDEKMERAKERAAELKKKRIAELEKIAGVEVNKKMQLFAQTNWLVDYILNKEKLK